MAITASSITSSATLEEFRIQFNNLVTDVSGIQDKNVFTYTAPSVFEFKQTL